MTTERWPPRLSFLLDYRDSLDKAKPNAHDKGTLFYMRTEIMSKKQQVNCIFAVHFDDIDDPRYKAITDIMMGGDMWINRNLVYAAHLDSRDELCAQIEKLEYKDDE